MLARLARPISRALSLLVAPALLLGLAGVQPACKPTLDANAPVNLIWDEHPEDGMSDLLKVSRTEGIKVLFWNVAWSSLNSGNPLEKNLTELIVSSARPHLIVLAEFKPLAVPYSDMEFLTSQYPHYAYVPYDATSDVGIAVLSEQPFTQQGPEPVDWTPIGASAVEQARYRADWYARAPGEARYWDRAYARFEWELAGHKLNLVPIHLLEPWAAFKMHHGDWSTLKNFFTGGDNPLKHQVRHLREKLVRDFGPDLDDQALLLLGDFNIPKMHLTLPGAPVSLPVPIPIYLELSKDLREVFDGDPFTFPAFSSPERQRPPFKYQYVKIDHGFVNGHVDPVDARVLPLRGSDHYPIYLSVKPGN